MQPNQISAFEYVSILISIILGLGITQILSSFSDLLYDYKKVKFYWPHILWIVFVLFLHIQDWFVTYELRNKAVWRLPELIFILLYPISLFVVAKMLLPNHEKEERNDMKVYYQSQFPVIFFIMCFCILFSILFNVSMLNKNIREEGVQVLLLALMLYVSLRRVKNETIHKVIGLGIIAATVLSAILEKDEWIIK